MTATHQHEPTVVDGLLPPSYIHYQLFVLRLFIMIGVFPSWQQALRASSPPFRGSPES